MKDIRGYALMFVVLGAFCAVAWHADALQHGGGVQLLGLAVGLPLSLWMDSSARRADARMITWAPQSPEPAPPAEFGSSGVMQVVLRWAFGAALAGGFVAGWIAKSTLVAVGPFFALCGVVIVASVFVALKRRRSRGGDK